MRIIRAVAVGFVLVLSSAACIISGGPSDADAFRRACECFEPEDVEGCLADLPDDCGDDPDCEEFVDCINDADTCGGVGACLGVLDTGPSPRAPR